MENALRLFIRVFCNSKVSSNPAAKFDDSRERLSAYNSQMPKLHQIAVVLMH